MYCSRCGNKLGDSIKFCQNCGAPATIIQVQAELAPDRMELSAASSPAHRPIRKIVMPVIVAISAVFIGGIATYAILSMSGTSVEQKNANDIISESPEEAAQAFAAAIASDDLESAVALFGCERRAESLDFTDYINTRSRMWVPSSAISYPSSTNIFTSANQQGLRNDASNQVSSLIFSLNADEKYLDGNLMQDNGEGTLAAEITEYCSPENLDTFKILQMDYTLPDTQNATAYIKNAESWASIYSAVTIADYTILYEYNGKTYFGGMQFIQYDDGWYIYNAYTILGGQMVYGYLTEMSESEYIERVETSDWDIKQE